MMKQIQPEELRQQWEAETLTVEQAIGSLLQHLCQIQTALEAENISLYQLQAKVDTLIAQLDLGSQTES